ncbi:MAG: GNAT family N-acetyltransferase [Rhodobacteraceae bacterium]|nr:GNAT family N-acetyltransferase [Paracoccaceae bacterium]
MGDLLLRPPSMSDFESWSETRMASREFLRPWEPAWPENDLTKPAFRRRLKRYAREREEGRSLAMLLVTAKTNAVIGGVTLANIRRGVSQNVTLGYWMGVQNAGKGYMTRAVTAVLPFCYHTLRLHRVEAACLPTNERSMRLLRTVGFRQEGYARNYLLINGRWQDHMLFSCLAEDWAMRNKTPRVSIGGKLKEFL